MIRLGRFPLAGIALLLLVLAAARAPADLPGLPGLPGAAPAPAASPPPTSGPSDEVGRSVVQVFATLREPNLRKPWTKQPPQDVSGSGMVIEGRRILTNAHVVTYATRVEVVGGQAGDRIPATVESIDPGMDLAVLKLDNDSFFDSHPPLKRAAAWPALKDAVEVYGYPVGGSSLAVTKGIVSRIEFVPYGAATSGLRIQIDAAINHGNSGGPVLAGSEVVGLAFSTLGGAQNIGYVIPSEEIDLFLRGAAGRRYAGKPAEYNSVQTLENPALRKFLKLPDAAHGVLVQRADTQVADNPLRKWDLITAVAGTPVDDEGKVELPGDLRVPFDYVVQRAARDGVVPVTVVRAGRTQVLSLPAPVGPESLFPSLAGAYPPYFILGPVVFSEASAELLESIDLNPSLGSLLAAVASPLILRRSDPVRFPGERLVYVAAPFFADEQTRGYYDPEMGVVAAVNGEHVRNLLSLVQIIRDSPDEFVRIDLAEAHQQRLIFARALLLAATERILAQNGIRALGSDDVVKAWTAPPAK